MKHSRRSITVLAALLSSSIGLSLGIVAPSVSADPLAEPSVSVTDAPYAPADSARQGEDDHSDAHSPVVPSASSSESGGEQNTSGDGDSIPSPSSVDAQDRAARTLNTPFPPVRVNLTQAPPFSDLTTSSMFAGEISLAYREGLTRGYSDGTFNSWGDVTRQDSAAFLYRLAGSPDFTPPSTPTFSDVPVGSIFYREVEWLNAQGITQGIGGGKFGPWEPIQRQAMAAFLYRYASRFDAGVSPDVAAALTLAPDTEFSDVPSNQRFAEEINWLYHAGITTTPAGGTFGTSDSLSRAAMITFIIRMEHNTQSGATITVGTGSPSTPPSPSPQPQPSPTTVPGLPLPTVTIARPSVSPFWDLPVNGSGVAEIAWAKEHGITNGMGDGTFRSQKTVTRRDAAAFLYRLAGSPAYTPPSTPTFSDVPSDALFSKEIEWLVSQQITGGIGAGKFGPDQPIERRAMAAFLFRYAKNVGTGVSPDVRDVITKPRTGYLADAQPGQPFADEVAWLRDSGLITQGANTTFRVSDPIVRESLMTLIVRMKNNKSTPVSLPAPQVTRPHSPEISQADADALGNPVDIWSYRDFGWVQYYDNGAIYSSSAGTYAVTGGIYNKWGGIYSINGLPTSSRYWDHGVERQDFQHGSLWDGQQPARTYTFGVQHASQPNGYYCGPTSGYMTMRYVGANYSAQGEWLTIGRLASSAYMNTDGYGYTSFHDRMYEYGLNRWLGHNYYHTQHTPPPADVKWAVMKSFETGYPMAVDEQERRGGPHFNGHSNSTFSHIMVVTGYDVNSEAIQFADPGVSLWYGAQTHFWYPNVTTFTSNHLTTEIERDGRQHIGIYYSN